jgi:hypothetical protein
MSLILVIVVSAQRILSRLCSLAQCGMPLMTPRERHDMKYIIGVAVLLVVILLLYIGVTAAPLP